MSATNLQSIKDAKKHLEKFLRNLETTPNDVLQEEARAIEADAKSETPFDSGKLQKSVRVRVSKSSTKFGLNISATARSKQGYDYSEIQHESKGYNHRWGKWHYLIDPFERGIERIKRKLESKLRSNWRK